MLIRILDSTVLGGRNVFEGDEVEAEKSQAKILLRMGKAIEVKAEVVEPVVEEVVEEKVAPKKSTKKSSKKKSAKNKLNLSEE